MHIAGVTDVRSSGSSPPSISQHSKNIVTRGRMVRPEAEYTAGPTARESALHNVDDIVVGGGGKGRRADGIGLGGMEDGDGYDHEGQGDEEGDASAPRQLGSSHSTSPRYEGNKESNVGRAGRRQGRVPAPGKSSGRANQDDGNEEDVNSDARVTHSGRGSRPTVGDSGNGSSGAVKFAGGEHPLEGVPNCSELPDPEELDSKSR